MPQPGSPAVSSENAVLDFDVAESRRAYNKRGFHFRHRWQEHPLLSPEALLELARRVPAEDLHRHRSETRIDEDFYNAQREHPVEYTLDETMRDIAGTNTYVMFRNPHKDPEYGALLAPLWDEIGQLVDPIDPGRCDHMSFIFVSPPKAVTPFHIDRVTTFHLQVWGEKTIYLWDPFDRSIVSDEDLSHVVAAPSTFHAPYRPEFQSKADAFLQKPGLGVHHPWAAPHSVEVGSAVSVSLAVTFRSKDMRRRIALYEFNHKLRQHGRRPTPIGQSPWRDALKYATYRGFRGIKDTIRRPASS